MVFLSLLSRSCVVVRKPVGVKNEVAGLNSLNEAGSAIAHDVVAQFEDMATEFQKRLPNMGRFHEPETIKGGDNKWRIFPMRQPIWDGGLFRLFAPKGRYAPPEGFENGHSINRGFCRGFGNGLSGD